MFCYENVDTFALNLRPSSPSSPSFLSFFLHTLFSSLFSLLSSLCFSPLYITKGKLRIAERFISIRDQGLFNNSDDDDDGDDDDDDEDDGEGETQKLTEKQKRELREKEAKKESKDQARADAKKKSAETRAAAVAAKDVANFTDDSQLTVGNMTGDSVASTSAIEFVPPIGADAYSERPTTMDGEEMQAKMWQDDKDNIARKRLDKMRTVQHKIDNNLALERDIEEWLAVYDILASPSVFAQSVYNLIGINHIMNDVAKIDNLPDKHTIEALLLMRHAWSNVDAYTYYADHYKWIAKVCYFLMLLLGIFIVSMGVILFGNNGLSGSISRDTANITTLGLSLASAIVAGYTSFMNPAARWHHLRSSALTL